MKIFLRQSHINYEASTIIDAALVCAILIAWPTRFENAILVPVVGVPVVIILCALAVKSERAVGLYINEGEIYCRNYF